MYRIKYALEKLGYDVDDKCLALDVSFRTGIKGIKYRASYFYDEIDNPIDVLISKSKEKYERYDVNYEVHRDLDCICNFNIERECAFDNARESLAFHEEIKRNLEIIAIAIENAVRQDSVMV